MNISSVSSRAYLADSTSSGTTGKIKELKSQIKDLQADITKISKGSDNKKTKQKKIELIQKKIEQLQQQIRDLLAQKDRETVPSSEAVKAAEKSAAASAGLDLLI